MALRSGQQQLKGRVTVTDTTKRRRQVWVVDISTVDFPNVPGGRSLPAETCLFWHDSRGGRRSSEVVATYASWKEAIEGHNAWVNSPREVADAMLAAGWRP